MGALVTSPGRGADRRRLLFVAANPSIDRLYEVDRLALGRIHRPPAVVAVPGGKGLNAARAAATLDGTVTAAGIVGGRAGDWILERLAELQIHARMAPATAETRTCVSILDRSTGALTEIYEAGLPIEPTTWDGLEAIVRDELASGDLAAIALSGSLPPGAPPDGYGRLARIAAAAPRPVPVLADTYGPALAAVLAERPALVKLNATEAGQATGIAVTDPASAVEAGRILRATGAASAVVTLGPDGAVVATADGCLRLVPPAIRGSYPVGSGDAFLGGLAVALARGDSLVKAARLGLAAGAANALVPGAGLFDPAVAGRFLDEIEVTAI